jgi:plastocyanin
MMRIRTLLLTVVLAAGALLLAACGGDGDPDLNSLATEAADVQPQTELTVVADDLEYDTDTIVVPANAEVSITLDNRDGGTLHNLAVYTQGSESTRVFAGDLFEGEATQTYSLTAPGAGIYSFRCDAHPDMNGVFIAR